MSYSTINSVIEARHFKYPPFNMHVRATMGKVKVYEAPDFNTWTGEYLKPHGSYYVKYINRGVYDNKSNEVPWFAIKFGPRIVFVTSLKNDQYSLDVFYTEF